MKFQLPPDIPPSHMWDIAIWPTTVAAVEAQGYTFSRDRDDLDSFSFAEVENEKIGQILLVLRDNPPLKLGIAIMVQADVFTEDALEALEHQFRLNRDDLICISPHPHYPGPLGELLDPPMTEEDRERDYQESRAWFYRELEKQNAASRRNEKPLDVQLKDAYREIFAIRSQKAAQTVRLLHDQEAEDRRKRRRARLRSARLPTTRLAGRSMRSLNESVARS